MRRPGQKKDPDVFAAVNSSEKNPGSAAVRIGQNFRALRHIRLPEQAFGNGAGSVPLTVHPPETIRQFVIPQQFFAEIGKLAESSSTSSSTMVRFSAGKGPMLPAHSARVGTGTGFQRFLQSSTLSLK